ncbi:hypothetical protein [Paenibacillus sp. FSL P4-0288]|uniref:hypothetical protein n=1 Tax=Paenibacillus sp. FSL P4-0288 TaxID=2921633 RepID=UPI0030F9F514
MNGGAIIEQLLLVEWSDTCEEVFLRVGEKNDVHEEVEQYAYECGKHSVKVTPIKEVDGYKIIVIKPEMKYGTYQKFKEKFQKNLIDPEYDPKDLLQNLLIEITSDENLDNETVGVMVKDIISAYKTTC